MINNVTLMGRLTAFPELKTTPSGANVTSFTLAIDRRFQPKGGEKQTDFINCVAWNATAQFLNKYFNKGDMLAVTGEIQTRKYTDKDGNNRIAVEVLVNQASFCGGKTNSNTEANNTEPESGFVEISSEYDLPF